MTVRRMIVSRGASFSLLTDFGDGAITDAQHGSTAWPARKSSSRATLASSPCSTAWSTLHIKLCRAPMEELPPRPESRGRREPRASRAGNFLKFTDHMINTCTIDADPSNHGGSDLPHAGVIGDKITDQPAETSDCAK